MPGLIDACGRETSTSGLVMWAGASTCCMFYFFSPGHRKQGRLRRSDFIYTEDVQDLLASHSIPGIETIVAFRQRGTSRGIHHVVA